MCICIYIYINRYIYIHHPQQSSASATNPFTLLAAEQLRLAGRAIAAEAAVAFGAEGAGAVGVKEAPGGIVQGAVHVGADLGVVLGGVLPGKV